MAAPARGASLVMFRRAPISLLPSLALSLLCVGGRARGSSYLKRARGAQGPGPSASSVAEQLSGWEVPASLACQGALHSWVVCPAVAFVMASVRLLNNTPRVQPVPRLLGESGADNLPTKSCQEAK